MNRRAIDSALLPLMEPTTLDTEYFGGMLIQQKNPTTVPLGQTWKSPPAESGVYRWLITMNPCLMRSNQAVKTAGSVWMPGREQIAKLKW